MTEEPQHLLRGRPFAPTLLGIERELGDVDLPHGRRELTFDERLDEQPREAEGEQRFDAPGVPEQRLPVNPDSIATTFAGQGIQRHA